MNGEDVNVIRNDIAHLAARFEELRSEFRDWRVEDKNCHDSHDERLKRLEQAMVATAARREWHDSDHRRISQQLGELTEGVRGKATQKQVDRLSDDVRKYSTVSGLISGGGFVGLLEIVKRLLA